MPSGTQAAAPSYLDDDIVIGEGVALSVPTASWIARCTSAIIDVGVMYLGYFASLWGFGMLLMEYLRATNSHIEAAWLPVIIITWTVTWFVFAPMIIELLTHGRSLGKLTMGLRIVRNDGGAIGFRQAFVRALVGLGEIYLTAGSVAAITGLFSDRSRRFGDLLAGTFAQIERVPRPQPLNLVLPPSLARWAGIADVARMPDTLARRIHEFFMQADKLTPQARQQLAGELARRARPYVHPIPDVDAETFLVGVSVVRRDREYRGSVRRRERLERVVSAVQLNPHHFPDRG